MWNISNILLNYTRYIREIKPRISMTKNNHSARKRLFTTTKWFEIERKNC
jgi:hypothetical protein